MRTFMQTLERKCQEMKVEISTFKEKFAMLQNKGLPSLLTSSGRLLTHEQCAHKVNTYVSNQITTLSSSSEDTGLPSGQVLYERLENLFYIEHEMAHLFEVHPNYYTYTDVDETLIKLQRHQFPIDQWWDSMLEVFSR